MKSKTDLNLLKSLRRQYPCLELQRFYELATGEYSEDSELLHLVLAEEDAKAPQTPREVDAILSGAGQPFKLSSYHLKMAIRVPDGVDLEHAQALLTYGFVAPSSSAVYAGSNPIPMRHLLDNVRNKMGGRFIHEAMRQALEYFLRHRVVMQSSLMRRSDVVVALNLREKASGVTSEGREIILAAKRFLFVS